MTLQNQGAPGITFAGFLILAALGAYISNTNAPTSSRPASTTDLDASNLEEGDIPARLWQDPYRALEKYLTKNASNHFKIPYLLSGDDATQSTILNIEHVTLKNLSPQPNKSFLQHRMENQTKNNSLTILGVMVDTAPFAESEERRRQRRFAVVSALGESNYVPDNEKQIHTIRIKGANNKEMILPYEWYTYVSDSKTNPCILVFWLDEARFSKNSPWDEYANFVQRLTMGEIKSDNITFKILGPASSTTLKKMYKECEDKTLTPECIKKNVIKCIEQKTIGGFHFLSPIATMADDLLKPEKNNSPSTKDLMFPIIHSGNVVDKQNNKINDTSEKFSLKKFSFRRTISTDDVLAELLVKDLEKRKIQYKKDDDVSKVLKNGTIILISEWDTSFGRSLPKSFMQKFCGDINGCGQIIQYSYLRGLDGKTAGSQELGVTTSGGNNKESENRTGSKGLKNIRRPVGTGQYDYMQRLAAEIKNINRKRYMQYGKGVVAIGILGSDVHDKLLILKILRSKLPSAIIFTTDMDAQLLHPSDFDWTRNTIVASSFGLRLNEKLQTKTPIFRNSYQTSLFFASLLAVKYKCPGVDCEIVDLSQCKLNKVVKPTIAEIGRYGSVILNKNDLESADELIAKITNRAGEMVEISLDVVNLDSFIPNTNHQAGLIVFIAVMVIIAWMYLNHKWIETTVWLMIGLAVFSLLTVIAVCISSDEPFSFSNGTSAWPALYIRVLAILLTIFFVIRSMKLLTDNSDALSSKYLDENNVTLDWPSNSEKCLARLKKEKIGVFNSICQRICAPVSKNARKLGRLLETKNYYKYVFMVALFIISALLIMKYGRVNSTVSDIKSLVGVGLVVLVIWCGIAVFSFDMRWINVWINAINKSIKEKNMVPISELWGRYKGYGAFFHRMLRTLCNVLFYLVIAASIFLLLGSSPAPIRGEVIGKVMLPVTLISVIGMLFIIFFVVDTTRLCIAWILALSGDNILWDKNKIKEINNKLNLKDDVTLLWIKMHMIAERTQVVGELIYFPFIIIILMLVSRISFFDHWGFPQALAIIITVNIVIATSNAFRLRNVAEQARTKILEELNKRYIYAQGHAAKKDSSPADQINAMIENIRCLREGAYKPFLEQPVVRGFIILLGGIGFSISQYSNAFN